MDNDQFAVDESGFTKDGYRRLNPKCILPMYITNLILALIVTGICAAIMFGIHELNEGDFFPWGYAVIAFYALCLIYFILGPIVFYKRYRYKIDEDKVEVRRGIITITHTLVPIERIHQVEVVRGPLNRMFGLANVNMTTAGGVESVDRLDSDVAEQIAEKLNEVVVKILKDRD